MQNISGSMANRVASTSGINNDVKATLNVLKKNLGMSQMSKLAIIWWSVWYFRNQIIFNSNNSWDSSNIAEFIKRQFQN